MKKHSIILFALTLGFVSCSLADKDVDMSPAVFKATTDWSFLTRTSIVEDNSVGHVYWESGDQINVNGKKYRTTGNHLQTAEFSAIDGGAAGPTYVAYYPADIYDGSNAILPAVQTYSATGANCPMYAASSTTSLDFKNICGVLKITVNSSNKLKKIKLEATENLSGTFSVNASYEAVISSGRNYVSLDCLNDGNCVDISTPKDFYIAIPPGTYSNFTITFIDKDNGICVKTLKQNLSVARNVIQPIALSSALVFVANRTVTYYDIDGKPISDPVEETNTSFNYYGNTLKIEFSNNKNNAINWAGGDVLDVKFTAGSSGYMCSFGDNTTTEGAIGAYTDNSGWWKICMNKNGSDGKLFASKSGAGSVVYMRLSMAGGLEYSNNGTDYVTAVAPNDQTILPLLLAYGWKSPFYIGGSVNNTSTTVTFNYLKVSRIDGAMLPDDVSGMSVSPSSTSVDVGLQTDLSVTVLPACAIQTVKWTSSDPSVAIVDYLTGKVTCVAPGSCTITATNAGDGSKTATCDLTVNDVRVEGVSLANKTIIVGQHLTLIPTITPSNAPNHSVSWSSSNTGVATIDENTGEVIGVAVGSCTVTATSAENGNISGSCTITVNSSSSDVYLWENEIPSTTQVENRTLEIIASGTPTYSQICFNNGDYIEAKIKRLEIPEKDCDLITIGGDDNLKPYIDIISHNSNYVQFHSIHAGGWRNCGSIQCLKDTYLYVRFGKVKEEQDNVVSSYSTDGITWQNWTPVDGAATDWNTITGRETIKIQTARADITLGYKEYEYVKIVRGMGN